MMTALRPPTLALKDENRDTKLDSVRDLGVARCVGVIGQHARGVPRAHAVVEVSVVAPSSFR